jgi:signal recognition particle GTPase
MNWRQIVHEIFLFFRQVKTLKQVWKTINKPIQKSPWLLGKRNDPRIEVEYDSRYGFLLFVTFHCRQPNAMENKNRHEKRKKKLEKMDKKLQQQKKQKQQKTQTDIFSKIRQNVTSSFSPTSIKTTTTNNNNNDEKQLEDLEHHLLRTFAEDLQQHQVIQSVASFLNE